MKDISCKKVKKLTDGYSQNILPPEFVQRIEAHLFECPACKKEYQETQEMVSMLSRDRLPDPGPGFWNGLSFEIMAQVRQSRLDTEKIPWYKKIWEGPFQWPGYAWVTALILILLTPVAIYTIHYRDHRPLLIQEFSGKELKGEINFESLPLAFEALSAKESIRLEKKVVARMGKDLPRPSLVLVEDELQWDVFPSLEGLNKQELNALINKIQTAGSAGFKEEESHVS